MEYESEKLLYTGDSLDTFLQIKYRLDSNGIQYKAAQKGRDNWFHFLTQLFLFRTGSRGMNDEHIMRYSISVSPEHYASAAALLDK